MRGGLGGGDNGVVWDMRQVLKHVGEAFVL